MSRLSRRREPTTRGRASAVETVASPSSLLVPTAAAQWHRVTLRDGRAVEVSRRQAKVLRERMEL